MNRRLQFMAIELWPNINYLTSKLHGFTGFVQTTWRSDYYDDDNAASTHTFKQFGLRLRRQCIELSPSF